MSQRNSEYSRAPLDLYATPAWVVDALAEHVILEQRVVWEPACGTGKMVVALERHGACVRPSDIERRGFDCGQCDFLDPNEGGKRSFDWIITNPPYGERGHMALQFIVRGLSLIRGRGALALLFPVDFDSAKTRRHVFGDCPEYAAKIVLTRRIVWFDMADKRAAPSVNHAWFIWRAKTIRRHEPPITLYAPRIMNKTAA